MENLQKKIAIAEICFGTSAAMVGLGPFAIYIVDGMYRYANNVESLNDGDISGYRGGILTHVQDRYEYYKDKYNNYKDRKSSLDYTQRN